MAPCIQKRFYRQYGDYSVYIVDGETVRDSIGATRETKLSDEEFGEWSIHACFPKLIPENEIWLEDDLPETEYPFVLANAFTQLRRLDSGATEDAAYRAGNTAEQRLRDARDAGLVKSGQIYVRQYVQFGPITAWLVNGEVVRDHYYVPFIEGGNHGRYAWIPANEVWLEYTMHPDELPFILIHECVERYLMRVFGWKYDRARISSPATWSTPPGCAGHRLWAVRRPWCSERSQHFAMGKVGRYERCSFCRTVLLPLLAILGIIVVLGSTTNGACRSASSSPAR